MFLGPLPTITIEFSIRAIRRVCAIRHSFTFNDEDAISTFRPYVAQVAIASATCNDFVWTTVAVNCCFSNHFSVLVT